MAIVEAIFEKSIKLDPNKPPLPQLGNFRTDKSVTRTTVDAGAVVIGQSVRKGKIYERALEISPDGTGSVQTMVMRDGEADNNATLGGFEKIVIGHMIPADADELVITVDPLGDNKPEAVAVFYHVSGRTPVVQ